MKWFMFILIIVALFAILSRIGASTEILRVGNTTINIQVADSDQERMQGLSGREGLAQNEGLLFVFEKEGYHGFWMKDMNFAIDMAWIDKDKKIIHIESDVSPDSYPKVFSPNFPSLYVLETKANFLKNAGIKIGDLAEF